MKIWERLRIFVWIFCISFLLIQGNPLKGYASPDGGGGTYFYSIKTGRDIFFYSASAKTNFSGTFDIRRNIIMADPYIDISQDGKTVVISDERHILNLRINGDNYVWQDGFKGLGPLLSEGRPYLSPSGKWLIYNSREPLDEPEFQHGNTVITDGVTQRYLPTNDQVNNNHYKSIAWSKDERRIAASDGANIFIMDFDGENLQLLGQFKKVGDISWAPDGSKIAFDYSSDQYSGEVLGIMSTIPEENPMVNTYYGSSYFHPSWSPDGSEIAYSDEKDTIWFLNPKNGHAKGYNTQDRAAEMVKWIPGVLTDK